MLFWFPRWITYDLTNIECFIYQIVYPYFSQFPWSDEFDICDIEVIIVGGNRGSGNSCGNPPCVRNSNTRRRRTLLQNPTINDGNISFSFIGDETIYPSLTNLSLDTIETTLHSEFVDTFPDINIDVTVNIYEMILTTTNTDAPSTTESTKEALADTLKNNSVPWNKIGYLIIAICIGLSILFFLSGLMYHGNKKGGDTPNYISIFIFFINTANLYTNVIFCVVLYTFNKADEYNLFIPAGAALLLTHIASITLETYFMTKLSRSKLDNPRFKHNKILLISTIFCM